MVKGESKSALRNKRRSLRHHSSGKLRKRFSPPAERPRKGGEKLGQKRGRRRNLSSLLVIHIEERRGLSMPEAEGRGKKYQKVCRRTGGKEKKEEEKKSQDLWPKKVGIS